MADNLVELRLRTVVGAVAAVLKPLKLTKRRLAFRYLEDGNAAIVEFQRSQSSTREAIRFTLNFGVVCGRLLPDFEPAPSRASTMHAHLRMRFGDFLPGAPDKWWHLVATTDPGSIIGEISAVLTKSAAPFRIDHVSDNALRSSWRTGHAPGMSAHQRVCCVAELDGIAT